MGGQAAPTKKAVTGHMELGKDTKVTFSLGTVISLVCTVAMGVLLYTQMASEDYVDQKIKEAVSVRLEKVEAKQEENHDRNQKLDTAIQLLTQSSENHDKNMEAFTRALEQLREQPPTR